MKFNLGEHKVLTDKDNFYIAENAVVLGKVKLCKDASVWFGAVIRGDTELITIGEGSNVQDCAVIHTDIGFPTDIGKNVTIGHQAMLHGCTIGDGSLVGINAVVLNGARIGSGCLIASNALVTEGMEVPDGSIVMGSPGKIIRQLTEDEIEAVKQNAIRYQENWKKYSKSVF